jgi:sugar O-acyltransferase (sialic acid O-acetyltransferase NeuD family)
MGQLIEVPRVNANEDHLQVIDIRVVEGQQVEQGEILLVLETTKAAVEVEAPKKGTIRGLQAQVGEFVDVGAVLCRIADATEDGEAGISAFAEVDAKEIVVTAKARKVAAEIGIDLAQVSPANGRISEAEVRAAAAGLARTAVKSPGALYSQHSRRAVIIGGGGHAACLIDALGGSGYDIVGCTDQALPVGHFVSGGVSVIGKEELLESLLSEGTRYAFIGIGGAESNETRRLMFQRASTMGFILPSVIHPSVVVSAGTKVGSGCHILAGATIGPRCTIGSNVIVNQGSIVCHDSWVDDHAHLTPGSILAGGVRVGSMTVVGMGATVLLGVTIGKNVLIHNGSSITSDVADNTIVDARGKRQMRQASSL